MNTETPFYKKPWVIILAIIVIIGVWGIAKYNSFASMNQAVDSSFATVDTQLQRRYDLIPNLVQTVKGNTQQEKDVFTALAEARTRYGSATSANGKIAASNDVESALSRLLVISENYPQLRSSEAFQNLMTELEGSENRIAVARRDYNNVVQGYNQARATFPGNLVAGIFGFPMRDYFKADAAAQAAPQVNFQQ